MKHILITLFLFLFASAVYADEIAITFDDLPGQQDELAQNQSLINKRILQALKKFNAPAIGFVNEGKLYSKGQESEKIAILKLWVDDGKCILICVISNLVYTQHRLIFLYLGDGYGSSNQSNYRVT